MGIRFVLKKLDLDKLSDTSRKRISVLIVELDKAMT